MGILAKASLVAIAVLGTVAAVAWWMMNESEGLSPEHAVTSPVLEAGIDSPEGELSVETQGPAVFRRVFWKHPGTDDRILHAERREWADEQGVTRWESFLELEPSERLTQYLFEQNAFQLTLNQAGSLPLDFKRPDWFPVEPVGFDFYSRRGGEMLVWFDSKMGRLFVVSKGGGFAPGTTVTKPERPVSYVRSSGRLPPTSPPVPEQEER